MTPLTGSVASRIAIAGLFPRFVAPMGTAPAGRSIPVAGNDTEAPRQAVASVTARRISGFVVHRNRRKTTADVVPGRLPAAPDPRSEEHTSELQALMRTSYAVFCLKKKHNK